MQKMMKSMAALAGVAMINSTAAFAGVEGTSSTFYGTGAGASGSGSSGYNTLVGKDAGFNSTGAGNTFIGFESGQNNGQSGGNTFIGKSSGVNNTKGWDNTFVGTGSGAINTTGEWNTYLGGACGGMNAVGIYNTYVGYSAGISTTKGDYNTFLGAFSGSSSQGNYNVFLGHRSGSNETGSDRLYIENSNTTTPLIYGEFDNDFVRINGTFETVWSGSNTEGDGLTNLLVLSANNSEADLESDAGFALFNAREDIQWNFRTHQNGTAFVATLAGTGGPEFTVKNATANVSGTELYLGNGAKNVGGVWINASSRALKENIKPLSTKEALIAFSKLQPVTYNYKSDKKEQLVGFIAEDVPELVSINSRDGLSAMDMVAVLTKVVQEQEKMMAEARAEAKAKGQKIVTMEARQRAQEEKIAKLESILTNLALDTSNTKKEKISIHLK